MSETPESPITAKETFAGCEVEIDASGDYLVNTTDAINGDVRFQLSEGRAVVVEIAGEPVVHISQEAGSVRIDLGVGASERLVLGDALMALLNAFFEEKFDQHTHPTTHAGRPTGPPGEHYRGTRVPETMLSEGVRTK
jgi:hypothetical protein